MAARTAADAMGARECLKMGGETKVLGMSELGCADADGVGAREWLEMDGEKKLLGMSQLGWRQKAAGDE